MGSLTLYAIKSSLTLALLYLPYTLLLRKDTFFRLNRLALLAIVAVSLTVPCLDIPVWHNPLATPLQQQEETLRSITLPTLVVGASPSSPRADAVPPLTGTGWGLRLVLVYLIGMLAVLVWKTTALVHLLRFVPSGCLWTDQQEGATIYCHAGQVSPFSWMRSVVIGEADVQAVSPAYPPSGPSPVLAHELAHVRLLHSWDVLFLSLAEVLQWFNPCVWMLDASLREVHEYEADDAVLRRGISAHSYQLLLIEKAVARSRYPMVNAFNHSLLKNRITMMTKDRTTPWARLKVLYAVPLTLIAIGAFASGHIKEKVKPLTGEKAQDGAVQISTEEKKTIHIKPGTLRLVVDGKEMTEREAIEAVRGKEIKNTVTSQPDGSIELTVTTSAPTTKCMTSPKSCPSSPVAWRSSGVTSARRSSTPRRLRSGA